MTKHLIRNSLRPNIPTKNIPTRNIPTINIPRTDILTENIATTCKSLPSIDRALSSENNIMEQPTRDNTSAAEAMKPEEPLPNGTPISTGQQEPPPKLSTEDFRIYNSVAEHMNYYHNAFRESWETLYGAANSGQRPADISIRAYLEMSEEFARGLAAHHGIEERMIFPFLAKKMPVFANEVHLLKQHEQIHEGLEKYESYIEECKLGERELRLGEVKEIMDTFGDVLWTHLDDEVKEIEAEVMRKYWTLDEMKKMPWMGRFWSLRQGK